MTQTTSTASAIRDALISPNEVDRNFEAANVVDALFAISRSLNRVATAIERTASPDDQSGSDHVANSDDRPRFQFISARDLIDPRPEADDTLSWDDLGLPESARGKLTQGPAFAPVNAPQETQP